MSRKLVLTTFFITVLIGTLGLSFVVQRVEASGTIYIRADGSIDPSTAPITTVDNVTYALADNVNDSIVVERDSIVIDGAGYTVQGTGVGNGIDLTERSNVVVKNTQIRNFEYNIKLLGSSNNRISGNTIRECWIGVHLDWSSDYNNISENDISSKRGLGLQLYGSSNNMIYGNNITENEYTGIMFREGSNYNNEVVGNYIAANNRYGITLEYSSNNTLRRNTMVNNTYNFHVSYVGLNDIDVSNTVNGKPICYWVNKQNMTAPLDAGYVALLECTGITVQNLNLTNNGQGIFLIGTNHVKVTKNYIADNAIGIQLDYSSDNTLSGNNVANNANGIWLDSSSSNNVLSDNNVTANNEYGIALYSSSNNTLYGNNVTSNGSSIRLDYSSSNSIFHNNFASNDVQVYSTGDSANIWDDGFPSGGNYWSDYNGTDTNHDSIGDTPYIIDANNTDHYPLMIPYVIPEFPSFIILPSFFVATLLAVTIYRRKRR